MSKRSIKLIIAIVSFIFMFAGCHSSTPESNESSSRNQQRNGEMSTVETSTNVLDEELLSASVELNTQALQEAKRQLVWLYSTLSHDPRHMKREFQDRVAIWTKFWKTIQITYEDHPVTWDREAIAKTVTVSSVTFSDLKLAVLLFHRSTDMSGFTKIATHLSKIRVDWLKLESALLRDWVNQDQIVLRKFPEVENLDLVSTNANKFSDWLKELGSSQSLLTRLVATSDQESRIYSERKGRIARLRDDIIPFWQQLKETGLHKETKKAANLLLALNQITDDYIELRLNLGKYLVQQGGFSFKYSLLISWGLADLFCRTVYLALLTDDRSWLLLATDIMELQLISSEVMSDLFGNFLE